MTSRLRHGIAPSMAAAILVASTLAAAAILTGLITTEQFRQGERDPTTVQCRYADLDIFDAAYSQADGNLVVQVANTDTIPLHDVVVVAERDGATQARGTLAVLPVGGLKRVSLNATRRPDRVTATSSRCPGVAATERDITVS